MKRDSSPQARFSSTCTSLRSGDNRANLAEDGTLDYNDDDFNDDHTENDADDIIPLPVPGDTLDIDLRPGDQVNVPQRRVGRSDVGTDLRQSG